MKIAVVGLGCVGSPLCLQFRRSGVEVLGFDIDLAKVAALNIASLVAPEQVWKA
jgi:UDP-N-acetyl-D-mannosaminuronate dehydrogenase